MAPPEGFCTLDDKTALVTGGSRGIGRAIALELARAGAEVVVGYRSGADEAEAVAQEAGGRALQADVSDPEEARRLVEQAGELDVLVNNAGLTRDGLLVRMPDADWSDVIESNLSGVFYTCRAAVRGMMKKRAGSIVNVSSIVGLHGNWGQTNYGASKAGIVGFTKSVAREVASRSITANAVAPGFVETDMTAAMTDKAREAVLAAVPMGRVGRPEDVAAAVLYLVSDAAAYVTGQVLGVDGGFHM